MDKVPICWNGRAQGELTTEREALYTWFHACCNLPGKGLWCVWVVGEQDELRLGVLEPCGSSAAIHRRFSDRMTTPVGRILRGELRLVASEGRGEWRTMTTVPVQTPWLRQRLQGITDILVRVAAGRQCLAIPYAPDKPFPLVPLFCFSEIRHIGKRDYAVFLLDEAERPVFPNK